MMMNQSELSSVTKRYLSCFYEILDEMVKGMTSVELTDSISHNFIAQMIPHHMAAIEMSRNILRYTTFVPVEKIAVNIIESQTKSIENMMAALPRCSELKNTPMERELYQECFQQIVQIMFNDMAEAGAANDINVDFMREMIPHHMGAIRMSENALRFPICQELKPILAAIITSQEAGVREMEMLLKDMKDCDENCW